MATSIALKIPEDLTQQEMDQVRHLLGDAIYEFYRSREENMEKYEAEGRKKTAQARIALAKKLHNAGLQATVGELKEFSCGYCKFEGVVSETSDWTHCPNCGGL
jgi:PHP family Zn ribbon phosphoesterase